MVARADCCGRRGHEAGCCFVGLVFWTPAELVEVLGAVAPDYAAFKVLMQRIEDGAIAVHSAAVLVPELFAGGDPGLRHTCLGVPDAGGDPDGRHTWVMHLPWQEQGHKSMLEDMHGGGKRRGGPRKRKAHQEGAVNAETTAKAHRRAHKVTPAPKAGMGRDATGCEVGQVGCQGLPAVPVQTADAAPSRRTLAWTRAGSAERDAAPDRAPRQAAGSLDSRRADTGQRISDAAQADAALRDDTAAMRAHDGEATPEVIRKTVAGEGRGARAPAVQGPGLPHPHGQGRVVETAVLSAEAAPRVECQGGPTSQSRRNRRRGLLDPAFAPDLPPAPAPATPDAILPVGSSTPGEVQNVAEGGASKSPGFRASKSQALEDRSLLERLRAGLESDSD